MSTNDNEMRRVLAVSRRVMRGFSRQVLWLRAALRGCRVRNWRGGQEWVKRRSGAGSSRIPLRRLIFWRLWWRSWV